MKNLAALKLVIELLTQLTSLSEKGLGRLLQRMHYVHKIVNTTVMPFKSEFDKFLDEYVYIMDCDRSPLCHGSWIPKHNKPGGQLEWNFNNIKLYQTDSQKEGSAKTGYQIRDELADKPTMSACVLDCLVAHPDFIPDAFKNKFKTEKDSSFVKICFWDTVYVISGGDEEKLYIRYLYWNFFYKRWDEAYCSLSNHWGSHHYAIIYEGE